MPDWLIHWLMPLLIQILSPILVEALRKLMDAINRNLPSAMVVPLAGAVAEAVNQLQAQLTGQALPYGLGGLMAVALNEIKNFYRDKAGQHPSGI